METIETALQRIVDRAASDETFRNRLSENPATVLQEECGDFADDAVRSFLGQTDDQNTAAQLAGDGATSQGINHMLCAHLYSRISPKCFHSHFSERHKATGDSRISPKC